MRLEIAAAHDLLESRVARRTRELASAFEFSQEIVAQSDLDHLLRSVTDRARALTHARAASLCLLDEGARTLALAASSGGAVRPTELRQSLQRQPVQRVIGLGQAVAIEATCAQCGFLQSHAPGQCAAAPLRAGENTLGALCVVRGEHEHFDPDETRALTLLANSAAIAIANARLAEAGRRNAHEAATLAERERLAAELHDHLAQTLGFLNLTADRAKGMLGADQTGEALAQLDHMQAAIGAAYGQVRAALVGLREAAPAADAPSADAGRALADRLAAAVADFS
jgi:nitrate/nitrite-specific signal transduction histidine kinase